MNAPNKGQWARRGAWFMAALCVCLAVALAGATAREQEADAEAERTEVLGKRIPELKFENVSLAEALRRIGEVTRTNVVVRWAALAEAGVERDTPVRLHLWDVSLSDALSAVLDEAEGATGGKAALGSHYQRGVLTVSTLADARGRLVVRAYDVRRLVGRAEEYAREADPQAEPAAQPAGGIFGQASSGEGNSQAERLITVIQSVVDSDAWQLTRRGATGRIDYFGGRLVVEAPPEVQWDVAEFLRQLAASYQDGK